MRTCTWWWNIAIANCNQIKYLVIKSNNKSNKLHLSLPLKSFHKRISTPRPSNNMIEPDASKII